MAGSSRGGKRRGGGQQDGEGSGAVRPPSQGVPPNLERVAAIAGRVLLVAVAALAVLWLVSQLMLVVVAVFVALLITAALSPPVRWLMSKGWPRLLATWAVVLPAYLGFFGAMYLIGWAVAGQFEDLGEAIGEGVEEIRNWFVTGPLGLTEPEVEDYWDQATEQIGAAAEQLAQHVVTGAVLAAEIVAGMLIALVVAFFLIKDADRITGWFMRHVPAERADTVKAAARRAWASLSGYLRGTIVISTVDSIGIGIGLIVVGVPMVLPLMVLTFIGGFFPIVGATVAGAIAVVVALVSGGLVDALIILGVVLAVQQIESNFLEPVVMARAVPLHPVVIIIVITTGAVVGGIVGAFLAVPAAAMVSSVGNELREREVILPGVRGTES